MLHCDFNKVIITGVPVKVSALNKTAAGVSVFNMTIRNESLKKSNYIDVTVWGELACKVHRDAVMSARLLVEGSINNYQSKKGSCRLEIHANRVFSLDEGRGAE